jgi:ABC-type transporter Mla maintaining outer membrane lipid asymmetry ATPase subunit MlaF
MLAFEAIPLIRLGRATLSSLPTAERGPVTPFDLTVLQHETVVVVGDESSGVDGLGALAMGLEMPPAGRARVMNQDISTLDRRAQLAFRRRVGYLPAGEGLLHNLTLRDNVRLPLRFGSEFQDKEIEGRVDVILAQLRLSRVAGSRPAQADAEERRRTAVARALAFDPELVILEQPFDGLTDRVASELLEAARGGEISEGSRRTVFITGQELPGLLRLRVDRLIRVTKGKAEVVTA